MDCCSIEEVLAEREKSEKGITLNIERKLEKIQAAAGRQAKQNIWVERLVTKAEWNTLIDAVRDCADDADAIRKAVSGSMAQHKLKGRCATCPPGTIFGRATNEPDLAQTILGARKSGSLRWAQQTIVYAKTLVDADALCSWLEDIPLGKYVMWATFNAAGAAPFSSLPDTADGIRAALGLPRQTAHQPLLLLQYALEAGEAIMPRVTEAYAGPAWTHYFRPAGVLERERGYGRTFPWDDLAEQEGAGEPEIVHEPIEGDRLRAPLIEKL
jgi:hypothetical protein